MFRKTILRSSGDTRIASKNEVPTLAVVKTGMLFKEVKMPVKEKFQTTS
jgi:hypothetical protein